MGPLGDAGCDEECHRSLVKAFGLSQAAKTRIVQNVFLSVITKLIVIGLAIANYAVTRASHLIKLSPDCLHGTGAVDGHCSRLWHNVGGDTQWDADAKAW